MIPVLWHEMAGLVTVFILEELRIYSSLSLYHTFIVV